MKKDVEHRDLEWTPEQVRRFWDYHGSNSALTDQYFGGLLGRSLLDYVARHVEIGTAVDVGCGRGHLLGFLIGRGIDAYGVDQSPASIDLVNSEFAGEAHFMGATVDTKSLPDVCADTVFMVEVIEHLNDQALDDALNEVRRLLKPNGSLVLTTPNEENLDASKIMCPNCSAVFHRMQHVRNWSADALAERLVANGFNCSSSEGVILTPYSGLLNVVYRFLYRLRHRGVRPTLVYIGSKI